MSFSSSIPHLLNSNDVKDYEEENEVKEKRERKDACKLVNPGSRVTALPNSLSSFFSFPSSSF